MASVGWLSMCLPPSGWSCIELSTDRCPLPGVWLERGANRSSRIRSAHLGSITERNALCLTAAIIIGYTGNIDRFPTRHRYASYNATAPIEASSGPKVRHRLNPRGNRQLNYAVQIIAISQLRHDSLGREFYDRKIAEGKTSKEALRALKRRLSDVVYRHLVNDARRNR